MFLLRFLNGKKQNNMGNGTAKNFEKGASSDASVKSDEHITKIIMDREALIQANQAWKTNKIEVLLEELKLAKGKLHEKDLENEKLKAEIHKLKSVIDVKIHKDGKPDLLATLHEDLAMGGQEVRNKKQGVSGESSSVSGLNSKIDLLQHFDKDFRYVS